jgi:signal transduction histidine kinase
MTRLTEHLLSTASIEARHVLIERQWNAVGPLINEALTLMQPLATTKDIQLRTDLPDSDNIPPVFVDSERTLQVFANLIGNAIKFSAAGASITVRAAQFEDYVQFSVEDTGPGIPEDQLGQIFDRFWQVPGTARSGTGLGLFIVKGIVEAQDGKVWAVSKVGVGSTFCFTLPIRPPDVTKITA